jgi:hypothetical protein
VAKAGELSDARDRPADQVTWTGLGRLTRTDPEAAAPQLDELLAVRLAQEALGQHAIRREQAAAVMAECAGVGPPTDLA